MISKNKLIFFASVTNILFINLICFQTLVTNYRNTCWIYLLIYIIIAILISILFKGIPQKVNFLNYIKKKYLIRTLSAIYLFIAIAILTIVGSIVIKKYFYFNANIITIFTIIIITSIVISSNGIKRIIDSSTVILTVLMFAYIIPFLHIKERDFTLLLPFNINISEIYKALFILIFPLENILFIFSSDSIKGGFSKSIFLLSSLFSGLYILFILIDGITLTGANFCVGLKYGGLLHWQLFQGNKFIENFDFFLLIILTTTLIYRITFYLDTIKKITYQKKSTLFTIILCMVFLITSFILYIFINYLSIITKIAIYINLVIIMVLYIIFVIISRKKSIMNGELLS